MAHAVDRSSRLTNWYGAVLGDGIHSNEAARERPEAAGRPSNDLALLGELVRKFAREREWQKYHNPRNLILALIGEIGELAELFQWRTDDEAAELMQDSELAARVTDELADVFGYLLQFADAVGVSLGAALEAKIRLNEERYPAHLARGNARKYTEFESNGD
jgi:dCTP diphosphatase